MKTPIMIALLLTLALRVVADDAPQKASGTVLESKTDALLKYRDKKRVAQKEYRDSLAEMILKADKIELFLLDFTMAEVTDAEVETFPIVPFQGEARVLDKKTVPTANLVSFKAAIAEVLSANDEHSGGVFCHYPIHGIKVFHAGVQIFQTSLCWTCNNYYVEYPDGPGIEDMSQPTSTFQDLFDTLLPIPPEEKERFKSAIEKLNSKGAEQSDAKK